MDIIGNIWGYLGFLFLGGAIGWYIRQYLQSEEIQGLITSISERDRRLLAISRDHKSIVTDLQNKYAQIKSNNASLERQSTAQKIHIEDLRNTTKKLRATNEQHLALLFEPAPEHISKVVNGEEANSLKGAISFEKNEISDEATNSNNEAIVGKSKVGNIKKSRKKLKKKIFLLKKEKATLESKLKKANKEKKAAKSPIVIEKEIRITERIDHKKLEKIISKNLPIIAKRKVIKRPNSLRDKK